MVGIYGIFRKSDNQCVYVGESKDLEGRIKRHLSGKSKIHLEKDLYYGKILETHDIDDHNYRLQRESFWINELNAELNIFRNICWPDEIKRKIAKSVSGEHNGMYGKDPWNKNIHNSDEHNEKIGNANRNRKCINNGKINKRVKQDELQQYLSQGWKLGRIKT